MRAAATILSVAVTVLASGPVLAGQGIAISCNPPLDRPLRLVMTQHLWLADGKPASVTATRTLRFVLDGSVIVAEAQLTGVDTDQRDSAMRKRLLDAFGAPGDAPIRIRLDAGMGIASIDDVDSHWQAFRDRQAGLGTAMRNGRTPNPRAQAIASMLDAMGTPERIAVLAGFLPPVLRHCGTMSPEGTMLMPDDIAHIETHGDIGGTHEVSRYSIDTRTGLLRTLDRSVTAASAPLQPMREHWTLEPLR